MDYVMLLAHVIGAILGVGAAAHLLLVLSHAARHPQPEGAAALATLAAGRFRVLAVLATVLLLLSGAHLLFTRGHLEGDKVLLLLSKVTLAVFVIAFWHAVAAKRSLALLRLSLLMALAVVAAGVWINYGGTPA